MGVTVHNKPTCHHGASFISVEICTWPFVELPDGICVKVVELKKTWVGAKSGCESIGGHLITLDSSSKHNIVVEHFRCLHQNVTSKAMDLPGVTAKWVSL